MTYCVSKYKKKIEELHTEITSSTFKNPTKIKQQTSVNSDLDENDDSRTLSSSHTHTGSHNHHDHDHSHDKSQILNLGTTVHYFFI